MTQTQHQISPLSTQTHPDRLRTLISATWETGRQTDKQAHIHTHTHTHTANRFDSSNPLQYSCLENPHGQRSLAVYRPWGCKESDMTERLSTAQHSTVSE